MSEVVVHSSLSIESSDRISFNQIADRSKPQQRSLNNMFCGCLNPRSDLTVTTELCSQPIDEALLPSSAIQSLKHLTLSSQSALYLTETDAENELCNSGLSSVSNSNTRLSTDHNAKLPPSALFPKSLMPPEKKNTNILDDYRACAKTQRNNWYRLKQSRWKSLRKGVKQKAHAKQGITEDIQCVVDRDAVDTLQIQSTLDKEMVFSPSSGQKPLYATSGILPTTTTTTLLGPRSEIDKGKKCFVIDLDETLVHSSFKLVEQADFKVGVEIDGITHRVYVLKRPHVDVFLAAMANLYECVLFTASLAKYADPVADFIDKWNAFRYRLFRDACVYHRGNYVKDLSHLGRPINQIVILDNSPASYMFHANHAVQISSWFDDANDRTLLDLIPYFERLASHPNVVEFLRNNTPPTPNAAVGSLGLPTPIYSTCVANTVGGRSSVDCGVISSIQRPVVSSTDEQKFSRVCNQLVSIAETQTTHPEQPKISTANVPSSPRTSATTTALPLITKMAAPSFGPSINPSSNDPTVSFPAPLSLATYLPVPTHLISPLTSTNSASGSAVQARVVRSSNQSITKLAGKLGNSNKVPSHPSVLPPLRITECQKIQNGQNTVQLPDSGSIPPTLRILDPNCSSSGENHHSAVLEPMKHYPLCSSPCVVSPSCKTSNSCASDQ